MPLQSRNTPRTDAPPQPAANNPPSKPREWLTPPFKEEFLATNTKPLLKKGDTATTSMLRREALKGPSSVCLPSCTACVVSGALASLSSRANASPSTLPKAFCAGAEKTSVVVVALVARKESKIPRQKTAIPAKGRARRSARLLPVSLPTRRASSPFYLRGGLLGHVTIAPYSPEKGSASLKCSIFCSSLGELPRTPSRRSSQNSLPRTRVQTSPGCLGSMAGHSFAAVSLAVGYRRSDVGLRLSGLAPAGLAEGAFGEVRWAAVPRVSKHARPGAARPAVR